MFSHRILDQLLSHRNSRRLAQHRHRVLHRRRRTIARMEQLEERRLLAVSTPVLGTSNDVVFNGDAAADSISFSVSGTGLLQHNRGGSFGFHSNQDLDSVTPPDQTRSIGDITSLTFSDTGLNDLVSFNGVINVGTADMIVDAERIRVFADISSTTGIIELNAQRTLELLSGSSVTTVDGGIGLSANANGITPGDFVGITTQNAIIETTGTGSVSLVGVGGSGFLFLGDGLQKA